MPRSPLRIARGIRREVRARTYDAFSRLAQHSDERLIQDAKAVWDHSTSSVASPEDASHWRNTGTWDEDRWNEYGQLHLGMIEEGRRLLGRTSPIKTVVEWGSGGGANLTAICPSVDRYFGVDISSSNLDECSRQSKAEGFDNFQPVLIPAESPEDAVRTINEAGANTIDCFLSTAVFQHLPGRKYARRVVEVAKQLLADDGIAIINIRYWNLPRQSRVFRRSYIRNAHAFNKYTIYEFEVEMAKANLEVVEIRVQPKTQHAYFFLRKK